MDPISPFLQAGLAFGGVIVCTSLFIWNTIELRSTGKLKDSLDSLVTELVQHRKVTTEMLADQSLALMKLSAQHATLAANQLNLTNSVNEVVRELIGIIREVE